MTDDPRARLDETSQGYQHATILLTANHLGLFRGLGEAERTVPELARELGLDGRALEVLLLALVAAGIVERAGRERFRVAPAYRPFLLPGGPRSLTSILGHNYHLMQRWVHLAETLRSGKPVGSAHAPRQGDELRAFICGMADISRASSAEVAAKYDFAPHRRLLDVGGGPGTAAITFARLHAHLNCVVFDLPDVLAIAREEIARAGVSDRVTTREGDFLVDALADEGAFDVVYVSNIIHALAPDDVAALFESCRRAVAAGGTIIVKDFFLDDSRTSPEAAARFSVNMLLGTEAGRSYTLGETRAMLARARFGECRDQPLAKASALLIAAAI